MSEELKPCPFCGEKIEPPKSRQASTDRSEGFVAFAACYCGGYSATAHKMGRGNTEAEAIQEVIALWNRRAQPAEADGPSFAEVLEQASVIQQLGAKNKRIDELQASLSAVTAERDRHLANAYALCAETVAKGEQIDQLRAEVEALRAFVTDCTETAGGMVNGNRLSHRAKELIAAMSAREA